MTFNLPGAIALLTRTPATLDALLRNLPNAWTQANEGPNTWNAIDTLGHLVEGERTDWIPRLKIILAHGDTRPFEPFDRFAQSKTPTKSFNELLDEFVRLRKENLATLASFNLQPEDFNRAGRHPALGPVTLSQLLATWTIHDLTHLHQLTRTLAHQYREAVGPWSAYLGVLHCTGHSAP